MKILVTGATGFVGREIVRRLSSENFEVTGSARRSESEYPGIETLQADVGKAAELSKTFVDRRFDVLVHCAGLAHQFGNTAKKDFDEVNVAGTKNIARIAAQTKCRHFILISSTAVYGLHKNEVVETSACRPDTDYARSKLEAENICRKICEANDIALTIFRLAPVLGEKGVGNMPRLIEAVDRGKFVWVGKGENKKSLIYVGDIAEACSRVISRKKQKTEIFNLASPPVAMKKIVAVISEELHKPVRSWSIPAFVPGIAFRVNSKTLKIGFLEKFAGTFEKWLSDDVYSGKKIETEYRFTPRTAVETALERQCRWYKNQKAIKK